MPVEIKSYSNIKPVNFMLEDPDRALDLSIPSQFSTLQGMSLLEYNFLLSANDLLNKNYTTTYLTNPQTEQDIFDLNQPEDISNSFATTLQFDNNSAGYLTIDRNNSTLSSACSLTSYTTTSAQSFTVLLTSIDNDLYCSVFTYDGDTRKYLAYHTGTDQIIFDTITNTVGLSATTNFNAIQSDNYLRLSLQGETATGTLTSSLISINGSAVTALHTPDYDDYTASTIVLSNSGSSNTKYLDKSNNFVYYTSGADIDKVKTLSDNKYNFLMYSNYEDNYIENGNVYANLNYFNLKNQVSNHHNVNKNLPFADKQMQRQYSSILNNETQEVSEEFLKLQYNFYTVEYNFQPDNLTKFVLPDNILPFTQINLNDAGLQEAGAYAGASPYFSDRIYKDISNREGVANILNENGEYLCSWLYNDGDTGTWYDRYYLPQNITGIGAEEGNLHNPPIPLSGSTSVIDQIVNTLGFSDLSYIDIESTLMFEPSGVYYYDRIGHKSISTILDKLSGDLVKRDFTPRRNSDIAYTGAVTDTLVITPSTYDTFSILADNRGKVNGLNISFELDIPNLEDPKAFQLVGNLFNGGLGIVKNFYFTPLIYLYEGNTIYYYDTDFNLLRETVIPSLTGIRDILYVSKTTDMVVLGSGPEGNKIMRVAYTGDVQTENSDDIVQDIFASDYSSRVMYGVGSKVLVKSLSSVAPGAWDIDTQTLICQPATATLTAADESVLRRNNNTVFGTMRGLRGVNLNDTLGAAISGTGSDYSMSNKVIFKDFIDDTTFLALSTNTKIWDINSFNEELYIQADNKLQVFSTERELLSSFTLSTSAVSGHKIDFVTEDYITKPLVFSKDINGKLIADKITLTPTTSSGYTLSSYALPITGADLGYNFSDKLGNFENPTNVYSMEQTFKEYENKFCLLTRFDNEYAGSVADKIWDTDQGIWSDLTSGNWTINYTGASVNLNDNSEIIAISNIIPGKNCIAMNCDLLTGKTTVHVNGIKVADVFITVGMRPLKNYLNNSFFIGQPNYSIDPISDFITNQNFNADLVTFRNFRAYNTQLFQDLVDYQLLECSQIDPINFDITTGTRNNAETIDNLFSYTIPGSLSNRVKIYIKNGGLSSREGRVLSDALTSKIKTFLPKNVTHVIFDFSIGNNFEAEENEEITYGLTALILPPSTPEFDAPNPRDTPAPLIITESPGEPIYDYKLAESDLPIFTQDGDYIYYE